MATGDIRFSQKYNTECEVQQGDSSWRKALYTASVLNEIGSDNPLPIEIIDRIDSPLEWYTSRKITTTNLTTDIPVTDEGDYYNVTPTTVITVDDATGAAADAVGNMYVEIWESFFQFQGEIIAVNGNDLTVSFPVEFPFTTTADVYIVDVNQNRDFTVTGIGEQIYSFAPGPAHSGDWHITRFMINMLHDAQGDSSLYGDQLALTNGIAFCGAGTLFPSETGLDKNLRLGNCLFNIKINADYKSVAFDVSYDAKSGNPAAGTLYGTNVRKSFNGPDKSGVVIPVRKARNERSFQIFRDDLSDLSMHRTRAIGHLAE